MSDQGSVHIRKTDTGYHIVVRDAEIVVIETDGNRVATSFEPDDDDQAPPPQWPLEVSLGQP